MADQVYHNDGSKPDADHPRAGWYCQVDDQGEEKSLALSFLNSMPPSSRSMPRRLKKRRRIERDSDI